MSSLLEPVSSSWSQMMFKKKRLEKNIATLELFFSCQCTSNRLLRKVKRFEAPTAAIESTGNHEMERGRKTPPR